MRLIFDIPHLQEWITVGIIMLMALMVGGAMYLLSRWAENEDKSE